MERKFRYIYFSFSYPPARSFLHIHPILFITHFALLKYIQTLTCKYEFSSHHHRRRSLNFLLIKTLFFSSFLSPARSKADICICTHITEGEFCFIRQLLLFLLLSASSLARSLSLASYMSCSLFFFLLHPSSHFSFLPSLVVFLCQIQRKRAVFRRRVHFTYVSLTHSLLKGTFVVR